MRRRRKPTDAETSQESLARLDASGAMDSPPSAGAARTFPVVRLREGYDMDAVDEDLGPTGRASATGR